MAEAAQQGVEVPLGSGRSLSPTQRGLWASQLSHPDSPLQNMPLLSHLQGDIDPQLLASSFEAVLRDSDVLRTRLSGRDQATGQWNVELITPAELPKTEIVELSAADVERWARNRGREPIDLSRCGYDSAIAVHEDGSISWYLDLHHVITDATSSALVFEATAARYNAASAETEHEADEVSASSGARTATTYYGWARKLTAALEQPVDNMARRSIDYWRNREVAPKVGRLYTAVDTPTPEASRLPLPMGPEVMRLAKERLQSDYRMLTDDLGWSALLMTATALYLHRVAGAGRFSIGMPVHNRSQPEARELIGPTMEVFPVDIEIEPDDTFRSVHKRVSRSILTTLRHASPGTAPTPDFEAVVNVIPRAEQARFGTTPATTKWLHSGAIEPSHLLRIQMTAYAGDNSAGNNGAGGNGLNGNGLDGNEFAIDVNHGASRPDHRDRATGHFMTVLSDMVTDPDKPIGGRTLCGPDELDRLARWEVGSDFDGATALLIEQLRLTLVGNPTEVLGSASNRGGEQSISGDQLWRWISAMAKRLTTQGLRPGDRVGIELPRSVESVVAIMAVLAAGGSFVPLDPAQPARRRRRLAERAGCVIVLTSVADVSAARNDTMARTRFVPVERSEDDEAYLLFTSGSTGEPKGVPITHGGLARYVRFAEESYRVAGPDGRAVRPIAPLFSALTFDLTITSLFMPIVAGGTLLVVTEDGPKGLTTIAATPEINWCKATPSHLELLVRLLPKHHELRTLVVGGEAFGARLASDLLAFNPSLRIFNEYGPTEAVVGCMIFEADASELVRRTEVPIGVPAPGVTLVVVDDHLQRVPIGSPGELCIAHVGVTEGYLGSADDDPDSPFVDLNSQRFYRSGDLVRLDEHDQLVYLGRKDAQVKVGGIRLEPIEVEEGLNAHPDIERAAVRLWSPAAVAPKTHCIRCGLPDNIPGIGFDEAGVCDTCHSYDRVAPITSSWFRTPDDLRAKLTQVRERRTGKYDCVHLLSGGKDSTYALYQLVELGFNPYVLTLDNGFIAEGALQNAQRSVDELALDYEVATSDSMNEIFRDSLDRYSNVCHGCYKTIYTLATNRAVEVGAPLIVTGLSRGQLFETRLIPQQFTEERFNPDAIDRAVIEARQVYHRVDDATNRMLDTDVFADDEVFEQVEYLDFYRYVDVELAEMFQFLDERAPWVRPPDTGRSTNCLINAAGIHTHQTEQGYHNYAVPYAWDVRLGHKTREEAIEELDDQLDLDDVGRMLAKVGYRPRPRQILTAWVEPSSPDRGIPTPAELRSFLADLLPAHAIPSAFVAVDELPLTTNGKLDDSSLPAPKRVHRPGPTLQISATTEMERTVIEIWERVLKVEPIGPDDDFFALGGDSLAALEMIVALGDELSLSIAEDLAFANTTPRSLAATVEPAVADAANGSTVLAGLSPYVTAAGDAPALSVGELAVLYDQATRPDDIMYNVGRLYRLNTSVDAVAFERALRIVASRHQPLSWSYASPRTKLRSDQAISFQSTTDPVSETELDRLVASIHRAPFDLDNGPLLRCLVQPVDDGSTAILFAIHHASGDAGSFAKLWEQIDAELDGADPVEADYAAYSAWQADLLSDEQRDYWLSSSGTEPAATLSVHRPDAAEQDGFLTIAASVTPAELRSGVKVSAASAALAAVATTVRRYSSGPDVEIGLITSARTAAADDLFGYFLNSVPVRINCGALGSNGERLTGAVTEQAASVIAGALANRTYPLARIVADRQANGRPTPEMNVLMAFDELGDVSVLGSDAEQRVLSNGTAVAPLTFFVEVRDDRVDLSLEHRGSVVGGATAAAMLTTLDEQLVALVASSPVESGPVALSTGESSALVGSDLSDLTSVLTQLTAHFDNRAGDAAVVCGNRQLTWSELEDRAKTIASTLVDIGVKPGDHVAVCLPRSVELIAAIVGIQLAGAAYVPIDPGYPDERIALIADRAGATVGVVDDEHRTLVDAPLVVSEERVAGRPWSEASPTGLPIAPDEIDPDATAYVIFTSGSTGEPRGVPVSHRHLAASTNARAIFYPEPPRRFLVPSSPAFDSSIVGLFWTLATGGTILLPTEDQAHDVLALHSLITSGISHTLMVPTLYQALLAIDGNSAPTSVAEQVAQPSPGHWPDQIIVAGEACPVALVQSHFEAHPSASLTNEYGPTEATVWSTAHHCSPDDKVVPIGPPIAGTWIAVVDDEDRLRPVGVEGDLIIGGLGVVGGYLKDDSATATKFGVLTGPIGVSGEHGAPPAGARRNVGDRFFRTGDRAVIVAGELRFLGRGDSQLNIGGSRAEPAEIEDAILAVDGVTAAIAVANDSRTLDELLDSLPTDIVGNAMAASAGQENPAAELLAQLHEHGKPRLRLVAHIETAARIDDDDIRDELRAAAMAALPPLLRPAHYELHTELPRTPNDKLDRQAAKRLPVSVERTAAPGTSAAGRTSSGHGSTIEVRSDGAADEPSNELVQALTGQFATILRTDHFGPDDSFFDHGGHSLLAMELLLAIEEDHDQRIPASVLYAAPTPRELAGRLAKQGDEQARSFLVPIQPEGTKPPIFAIHVLGIGCQFFRPLAARLGNDQPMYGLGQPATDLDLDTAGPTEVSDVAAVYADEINRVAPTGPLSLAAISLGGVVAYELAQQLVAQGRDVSLLALFDALGPDAVTNGPSVSLRISAHMQRAGSNPARYASEQLDRQGEKLTRTRERANLAIRNRMKARTDHQLEVRRFIEDNLNAQWGYVYDAYPGQMLVIKAEEDPFAPFYIESGMGWARLAVGGLEIDTSPGAHLTMMAEPHVETVANSLRRSLDRSSTANVVPTVDGETAERLLTDGLRAGRLPSVIARLGRQPHLSAEATTMVDDGDRLLEALAVATKLDVAAAAETLSAGGLSATVVPVPSRLQHATAAIEVVGDPLTATEAMASIGYLPVDSSAGAALIATIRSQGAVDYIRRGEITSRIRLRWQPADGRASRLSRVGRRLAPTRNDFEVADLPEWAWPAYWPIRPYRVARDRMRTALHARGIADRSQASDLGIFLGTPPGLIAPLLRYADVAADQLVVDIGCGDGRVLIDAAREFGCRGRGFETDGALVAQARAAAAASGVSERVEIVHQDATEAFLGDADVVFAFLPPEAVASILEPTLAQLSPGAVFISHEQLAADLPLAPDQRKLIIGLPDNRPETGGITVANLWFGRAAD